MKKREGCLYGIVIVLSLLLPACAHHSPPGSAVPAVPAVPVARSAPADASLDFLNTDLRALAEKATRAYEEKDYAQSAELYLDLLRHDIGNQVALYNLACCYGLMGDADRSAAVLKRSVSAGYRDLAHMQKDPDFDPVREKEPFRSVFTDIEAKLGMADEVQLNIHFIKSPAYFPCIVRVPDEYDPERAYPLILGLHGFGGNAGTFLKLWDRFEQPEFIFASLRAPYALTVGNGLGYSWELLDSSEDMQAAVVPATVTYITTALENLRQEHRISDVYLLGFSQGATFSVFTGITNPELFRGVIEFGGWLDEDSFPKRKLEAAKDLRIFIGHGREDKSVPFTAGEHVRDVLKGLGYNVTFHPFDDGHTVAAEPLQHAQRWMEE